jgi:GNAT superfamily N-acetyltransferase
MSSPPRIHVRQAELQDADVLVGFSAALARETEDRHLDLARLRQGTQALLATAGQGFFIVAERHEDDLRRPVGQLMITFEWSDWRNGLFWWIQSVYVAKDHRGQGVFRAMHEYIVAKAKSDPGICGIRLYVERENRNAQTVYQRVGLVPSPYTVFEQDFVLEPHGKYHEQHQR